MENGFSVCRTGLSLLAAAFCAAIPGRADVPGDDDMAQKQEIQQKTMDPSVRETNEFDSFLTALQMRLCANYPDRGAAIENTLKEFRMPPPAKPVPTR
jgi:hypothetical protein